MWLPRGWGREGLGVWDQQMQTIINRMDKQQGLTAEHRIYIQYPVINQNGKEYRKECVCVCVCVCVTESLCCTAEINTL